MASLCLIAREDMANSMKIGEAECLGNVYIDGQDDMGKRQLFTTR